MIKLLRNPLDNIYITSKFGIRVDPVTGKINSFHNGVDFRASIGTKLYAVADGKVVVSKANGGNVNTGYGYYQVIQHDGFYVLYGHMRALHMLVGQTVKAGDIVGYSGNTGKSTGAHLHFEIREGVYSSKSFIKKDGKYLDCVDPEKYLLNGDVEVIEKNEFEKEVELARAELMKFGITDGNRPKENITREEVWVMLYRLLKK